MQIPRDKQLHFAGGFTIAMVVGLLGHPWGGALLAAVVGALKEAWDAFHPETHCAEWADFFATALGGLVGAALVWSL